MGTLVWHKPRGVKAIDELRRNFGDDWWGKHVVASSATREAVFLVVQRHEPDSAVYVPDADGMTRGLAVLKLSIRPREHMNFGYKDMSETCGPYGCEAPLSILDKCSALQPLADNAPEGYSGLKSATEYRERCAKLAAAKALKRDLKPGDKVTLREPGTWGGRQYQTFTVVRAKVRGRKAKQSTVFWADVGVLCSISAAQLAGATVIPATN